MSDFNEKSIMSKVVQITLIAIPAAQGVRTFQTNRPAGD
jgi:hypothetical protein